MKRTLLVILASLLLVSGSALAAKQTITSADTGAQSRTKLNSNFTELYNGKADASCFATESAFNACFDLTWAAGGSMSWPASDGAYYAAKDGAWASLATVYQPLDSDLTTFSGLACTEGQIPKKNSSSVWVCGSDVEGAGGGISHATSDGNYYASRNGAWANISTVFPTIANTLVGDCTVGPCLDGTSDGGNIIKLYAGTGSYWTALQGGAPAANRSWRLPIAAAPSAGTTRLMNMDEYGQMGFVDPATFASALGGDDNYVTDAEKTKLTNLSGTNSGDNAVNSNYSSLVTNATHTGDVTGSGALTIANDAVTLAKMANMATASVIYRKTASTGDPEVQTLATLKTDLGLTGTNSGDQTLPTAASLSVDDLITLSGVATGAVNLGTFTGATIADSSTVKTALQAVETEVETKADATNISFIASALSDMKILDTAQPVNGSVWVDDALTYGATDDNLHLWSIDKVGSQFALKAPIASPTFTGKVTTAASATGGAGLNLPHGAAPTSPVDGDIWTTSAGGLYARINGSTVGPFGSSAGLAASDIDTSAELRAILGDEVGTGAAYFVGGALGTPASATLTNATGLPLSGVVDSTTEALGAGTIELGAATDTTISRAGAGAITVESVPVTLTIASGTSALGTGAITSGACATVVTTTATNTATTDVINWGFNGDPTGVTGYAPSANGMLTIIAYPSSGNVNYKVCNNTAASITPGAITLNWRVLR